MSTANAEGALMRIVAWNLGHQTREAPISERLFEALQHVNADVVALNEFVDGESRGALRLAMTDLGLPHIQVSVRHGKHNQVLIASRFPQTSGTIAPPGLLSGPGAAESNFLHVQLHAHSGNLDLIALRAPAYKMSAEVHYYWQQLQGIARTHSSQPLVFVGDLNADPDNPRSPGGSYLRALERHGYTIPRPPEPWSFWRGSRIDHAILAPGVKAAKASYLTHLGDWAMASGDKLNRISDHAALVLDLEI